MPKTAYGVRYWLDRFPASRVPSYPRQRGTLDVDVAIVGGGGTGCVTAYAFAAAGIDVALLEAARLGQTETSASTGIVLHEPDADLQKLVTMHGLRVGRQMYEAARRGSLEYLSAIRRLRIDGGMEPGDAIHLAPAPEDDSRLRKEYSARREAGLEVAAVSGMPLFRQTGFNGFGIRTRGTASVDPYRATLGFARAAAARGAKIFERSPATRIKIRRKGVEITTKTGSISASHVILATGYPTDDYKPLRRRFTRCHSYTVLTPELPADIRREIAFQEGILRDTASPDHWMRRVQGSRILFSGGDQPSVPDRARERAIVQRTGQLMYELSLLFPAISGVTPEYGWDAGYARSADGVPYFGPHRNYPHHQFAFGSGPGGLGLTFLAARILLRHYLGKPEKGDEAFSFTRIRE